MILTRPTNAQFRLWQRLNNAKARLQEGLLLAEGIKVVGELLKSAWTVKAILVREGKGADQPRFLAAAPPEVPVYFLAAKEWNQVSQDKSPEGVMAVAALPERPTVECLRSTGHIILAYRINNPNNLGALIRTAHWFGFAAIALSSDSVDFANPKVVRTSMGSLFHLTIISDLDFAALLPTLKERYLLIAGDARKGTAPHPCAQQAALLLGSESYGLPTELLELAAERWRIPGAGSAESLSLPQAAAVMMYAMGF